jgi:hypothetical protein
MAATPSWMLQIPDIIADLNHLSAPVVDRAMFEKLFGVKRRRAIDLMQRFGGFRSGNTVLVERLALIAGLEHLLHGPDYDREYARKQRLVEELDVLERNRAAARIKLRVSADVRDRTAYDLPPGISLEPGRLVVEFSAAEELFGKLFELAQAAANDFDGVCNAVTLSAPPKTDALRLV